MGCSMHDIYRDRVATGGLAADPAQEAVLPEFERIRSDLSAPPPRLGWFARARPQPVKGLYLWGGVGRGKSMLMDLFFDSVDGVPKRRVHFHAFMQEVHAGMNAARKRGVDDAIAPVAEDIADSLRLLCFDEMQISDVADAMIVGRLFEKLFAAGVVIVTTSNRVPDDLYKNGLNRQIFLPFIALLKEHMIVHHLTAARDYRQDRLAGAPVYFAPADAAARQAMDRIWSDLARDDGAPLVLHVQGREVTLPRVANGVARVSFWDLCGRPLGPADYLAVAQSVRVLMLEDVPCLSSDNYNEARRFVTLIDALYEGGVRLIVSAADLPEKLYLEGEGLFEFERTASRLREMQSAEWGGA
jgi:cell division protein ZapE